jgi:hypothetical protein
VKVKWKSPLAARNHDPTGLRPRRQGPLYQPAAELARRVDPEGQRGRHRGEIAFHGDHDASVRVVFVGADGEDGSSRRDERHRSQRPVQRLALFNLVHMHYADDGHAVTVGQGRERSKQAADFRVFVRVLVSKVALNGSITISRTSLRVRRVVSSISRFVDRLTGRSSRPLRTAALYPHGTHRRHGDPPSVVRYPPTHPRQ